MQLKAGTVLQGGKYEIVCTIGQGGFGITYEAFFKIMNGKVVVKEFFMKDVCNRDEETSKVSVPSVGSKALVEKFKAKFVKEAQTIFSFNHPNIIRVMDVFEENGTAYYVMDYLPGGSLKAKVDYGPLPEHLAEKYIREVASALDYVHKHNTVHLDVKPANILLNSAGEAVLIDFGISKHYDKAGEQTSSTPVGISKGYAPLEQGRDGDVKQFGPSTDIYALGATLYHLLSGQVPPEASIVNEDGLDRPTGISDRMWRVITKSMEPKRKDRPQSIAEFLSLLDGKAPQPVEDDEDITIIDDPEPAPEPAPKPVPNPTPGPEPAPEKTWLWALLGGVAAAAVILWAIIDSRESDNLLYSPDCRINGHEYVDLGLSVKWATCNVGASKPEDYGDYFAWGEVAPKSKYIWVNYKFRSSGDKYDNVTFWKYNTKSEKGTVDSKTTLDRSDDAARANWGGSWRMPTRAEQDELLSNCTWTWTSMGGHNGYKVTSKKNGNSIFLPAAGCRDGSSLYDAGSYGSYWSSSLSTDYPRNAYYLFFGSSFVDWTGHYRYSGQSIRPVTE